MLKNEKIAVVIPIYNIKDYLCKCLDSVLAQSYSALEILLVDDGSTDGSGEIADSYAERDNRVSVLHIPNSGVARAREIGVDSIGSSFVVFVDGDDYLPEDAIENLSDFMRGDIDIVVGSQRTVTDEGSIVMPLAPRELDRWHFVENVLHHHRLSWAPWGKLYRVELFSRNSFPRLKNCEDLLMTVDVARSARRVRITADVVYNYVQREDSASHRFACILETEKKLCFMLREYLERGSFLPLVEDAYTHFAMLRLYMCAMSIASDQSLLSDSWAKEIYRNSRNIPMTRSERIKRLAIRYPLIRTLLRLKR